MWINRKSKRSRIVAYEKGKKVDCGIWRLKAKTKAGELYVAEVSFPDPETQKRTRRWKTSNRIDSHRPGAEKCRTPKLAD